MITGADCSGGVVGLLRHAGVVKPTFDLAADGFAASKSMQRIEESELLPADLLHKTGHIGMYVGGGYAAEWMGGAYGCQLTRVGARRGWNFVKHKQERFGAWTAFLRPKWY
jgi:cell wall-associated NlpC family hydrolase